MNEPIIHLLIPLLGGVVIGLAVSAMLILNGRVTGVSGILNGALKPKSQDWLWRICFILGLLIGGLILHALDPQFLVSTGTTPSLTLVLIAGLLTGFGTVMGNGCTSGHGICGLSRFSKRSLIATLTFMGVGMLTATFIKPLIEGLL